MPVPRMFRRLAGRQSIVVARARQDQDEGKAARREPARAHKPLAPLELAQQHAGLTLLIRALARELAREDHARAMAPTEQTGN